MAGLALSGLCVCTAYCADGEAEEAAAAGAKTVGKWKRTEVTFPIFTVSQPVPVPRAVGCSGLYVCLGKAVTNH